MLKRIAGFSLLEVVIVLLLSSVVLLSITAWFPELIKHHLSVYQRYRLEQMLNQVMAKIVKDLKRAGFVFQGKGVKNAILFNSSISSACLIVRYDLNSNGDIEQTSGNDSELFGYRWQQEVLEQGRGRTHCDGSGWERIIDQNDIRVTDFQVITHNMSSESRFFEVKLSANWLNNQNITQTKIDFVRVRNQ